MVGHGPESQHHQKQEIYGIKVLLDLFGKVKLVGSNDDDGPHLSVVAVSVDTPILEFLYGVLSESRNDRIIEEHLHL